jgi:hypothetical protein
MKTWNIFLPLGVIFVLCACASPPSSQIPPPHEGGQEYAPDQDEGPVERFLIRTEPGLQPDWKDTLPKSEGELFFVGVSKFFGTAAEARDNARENAFIQVMRFYGEFIRSRAVEKSSFAGSSAETLAALIIREEEISNFAQAVVSRIGTDRYYTEIYLNGQNQEEYLVYALCQIPRQKAEQDITDFAKNTSERYGRLLVTPPTLHAALSMYGDILDALEENPLHRAVAYYDGPEGRVNLYEYLSLQLIALTGSVSFAPLPAAEVEKTCTLDRVVTVLSPLTPTGALDCGVSIYGLTPPPRAKYTVRANNSFSLKIFSSRLEPGRYTVYLELLLTDINPRIQKNPSGSFSLEVKPVSAGVDFVVSGGSLGEPEKTTLLQGIQQGIQNYGVPVSLRTGGTEQSGNVFTISLNLHRQPAVPPLTTALLVCEAMIAFSRSGVTQESAWRQISEIDAAGAVGQVRKFIVENEVFFQNITRKISQ